jgi:hypothetical protein
MCSRRDPGLAHRTRMLLQQRSTNGLHLLLDVFIHCGRFYGKRARCCGALCILYKLKDILSTTRRLRWDRRVHQF